MNVFQRLIRQWERIHPYNAAQIMRLRGRPDVDRLDGAWVEAMRELGVGPQRVVARRFETEVVPLARTVVEVPAGQSLESYVAAELNRAFDASGADPFRPFVMVDEEDRAGCYFAGVVYQHWVADSVSVRTVLREWLMRLIAPDRARRTALPVARSGYWRRFGPWTAQWSLLEASVGALRWAAKLKRARRIEVASFSHPPTRFTLHALPARTAPGLLAYARSRGVTLNDLFLAVIAMICDRHVAAAPNAKRRDLALGTIVDLRRTPASDPRATGDAEFGLFLGFTSTLCRGRDLANWDTLLPAIAQSNAAGKRAGAAEASMLRMTAGLVAGRLWSTERLLNWYRKRLPLCAGISNVNLSRTWVAEFHPHPVLDYIRVSPVGPIMPVVFTPSTLGDTMHFGLTCRESVVSRDLQQTIAREFSSRLVELAGAGRRLDKQRER
jgi:hypothetical protein